MNRVLVALAVAAPLAFARRASADPCAFDTGTARTPIAVTTGEARFATTPSPCPTNSLGLELRGSALIAVRDYYGALQGEVLLSGSLRLAPHVWVSADFTATEFTFAQDATFIATEAGLGPTTVALHAAPWRGTDWQVSTYLRALVPTTTGEQYAAAFGIEPGASAVWALTGRVSLFAGVSVPMTSSAIAGATGRAHSTVDPRFSVDASWLPWRWLEGAAGVDLRFATDDAGPLDYLAPKVSLRFHPSAPVAIALSALFPVAGTDRTLVRGALGASGTF